jgi:hypothetical protein
LPKRGRRHRDGEAEYERHFVGRDIADTLNGVMELLRGDAIIHRDHQKQSGR